MNPDPRLDTPYERRVEGTAPYDKRVGYTPADGGATYWIVGGLVAVVLAAGIFIFAGSRTEVPPSTAQVPATEQPATPAAPVTPTTPPAGPATPAPVNPANPAPTR